MILQSFQTRFCWVVMKDLISSALMLGAVRKTELGVEIRHFAKVDNIVALNVLIFTKFPLNNRSVAL